MGRIRTLTVKRAAKKILNQYSKRFKLDFNHNKQKLSDVAEVTSKKLRNKIAGYLTSLKKQESKGHLAGSRAAAKEKRPSKRRRGFRGGGKRK